MEELSTVPVSIVAYDPRWPSRFIDERASLAGALGRWSVAIEHIGSTAVPGLAAKPIIDIMVGLSDLADVVHCIEPLATLGYRHLPGHPLQLPDWHFFHKGRPWWTHQVHAVPFGGPFWRDHLRFREALRHSPDIAAAYEALKRQLAQRYGTDRVGYSRAKDDFVRSVLEPAGAESVPP